MPDVIAVMNTKGGVGKSTLVMALAETLSSYHGKRLLLIDSDSQMSLSLMMMPVDTLQAHRQHGATLVDLLNKLTLERQFADWKTYLAAQVSDVDDAQSIWLLPSDMHLTLFEREVSAIARHAELREAVRSILADARNYFDIILIDCPPGFSILTETWLREADYHLTPVKPDFLAVSGLETFRSFKKLNPELGFATNIGVVVNLKDDRSAVDGAVHKALLEQEELRCFPEAVPRLMHIQQAAMFMAEKRSFLAKYPGVAGASIQIIAASLCSRLDDARAAVMDDASAATPAVA